MSEKIEKSKGRTMNEIILDMEQGTGSASKNQVGRILERQTEMMARRVEKSEMEQIMAESERKKIEEENRLKLARQGQMPTEPQPKEAPQEAKNILDAVKVGLEAGKPQQQSQGSVADTAKTIVEAIKIGVDMGKAQTLQVPQQSHTDKYLDLLLEELKLARQDQAKERERRLEKEIAAIKDRPSGMEEIAHDAEKFATYRKMFGGGDPAVANEYTLKKLEMEQTERLEDRKLGFEEKKWEHQKDSDGKTFDKAIELVKTVSESPIGRVLENLGSAGVDKVRGSTRTVTPKQIPCPSCGKPFWGDPDAPAVICGHCGTRLEKRPIQPPQQQPPQPMSEPVAEAQQPSVEQQQPEPPSQPTQ